MLRPYEALQSSSDRILIYGMQVQDAFTGSIHTHADEDLCRQNLQPTSIVLLKVTEAVLSQAAKAPLT